MNKKKKESSPWTGIVIVLAALIMGAADGSLALLLIAIIAAIVVIVSAAAKKQTGAANVWKTPADAAKARMDAHEMKTAAYPAKDESRQPLHCTCSRGKQRYLDQAAMFYKNGLIDRSEYNVMCEKYNKLNIPEDF